MATNKKITALTELVGVDLADDDVIPIVDISAGTTHKIKKSTLAAAVAGVSAIAATSPIAVDEATGSVTVSTGTIPVNKGGTGVTTLTDGGVLLGSGTGTVTTMAALADGEVIVGDGTTDPVAESGATLRTSIGVGTGDSPQFTAVNIGAATDTTVARSGAGDITVEGNAIYRAGGTDVPVADGGTGRSTLTANYVLLGDGTSAVQMIAPGTSANVLTSDGSTWASTAAAAGGAGYFLGNASGATGDTSSGLTDIFRVNNTALATSVEIAASTNASATGPLTVNSSITLTVTGTLVII